MRYSLRPRGAAEQARWSRISLCVGALTSRPPTRGICEDSLLGTNVTPTCAIPRSAFGYRSPARVTTAAAATGHGCGPQDRGHAPTRLASGCEPPIAATYTAPSPAAAAGPRARYHSGRTRRRPRRTAPRRAHGGPSIARRRNRRPARARRPPAAQRSGSITHRPHATSAASDRDKTSAACGITARSP